MSYPICIHDTIPTLSLNTSTSMHTAVHRPDGAEQHLMRTCVFHHSLEPDQFTSPQRSCRQQLSVKAPKRRLTGICNAATAIKCSNSSRAVTKTSPA